MRSLLFLFGVMLSQPVQAQVMPESPPMLMSNPMTPKKVELGKKLFFDPILSQTGKFSCNSCHDIVKHYGTTPHKVSRRNPPSVWNSTFHSVQFLDGRSNTPEDQIVKHLLDPQVMGPQTAKEIVKRVENVPAYNTRFRRTYFADPISLKLIAEVISQYERTLTTLDSPYDRYQKGDQGALNAAALQGMKLFHDVGCSDCHGGALFSGPNYPLGIGFYKRFPSYPDAAYEEKYKLSEDLGRYEVNKYSWEKNVWRVPTLRNIELTAPYFHNGSVQTLSEAVRVSGKMSLNVYLSGEQVDLIVEFLKSLTAVYPVQSDPRMLVEREGEEVK